MFYIILQIYSVLQCRFDAGILFCNLNANLIISDVFTFCLLLENMIRGLDGDETVFLDLVAKQQEEIANRRFDEESQEIKEYRVL